MDAAGWAAIAVWAGVVVTAPIATYTIVLARQAKAALAETLKARDVAQDQAHHARVSASAARLAADAAVDSARSGRESVEIARATFDREDRPTFGATLDEPQDDRFLVTVKLLTGPPETIVTVRWAASSEGPGQGGTRRFGHQVGGSPEHRLVPGDRIKVRVGMPSWADQATIKLDLYCTDAADKDRTWPVSHVLEWVRPPQFWAAWR